MPPWNCSSCSAWTAPVPAHRLAAHGGKGAAAPRLPCNRATSRAGCCRGGPRRCSKPGPIRRRDSGPQLTRPVRDSAGALPHVRGATSSGSRRPTLAAAGWTYSRASRAQRMPAIGYWQAADRHEQPSARYGPRPSVLAREPARRRLREQRRSPLVLFSSFFLVPLSSVSTLLSHHPFSFFLSSERGQVAERVRRDP